MHNQSLQQHSRNLLPDIRFLLIRVVGPEKVEKGVTEVVGMAIGIAELIRDGGEEVVAGFWA